MGKHTRIDRIIDRFLHSEYFATWQAEQLESCAYSRDSDDRDRYARCYEAAEDGSDGSTHREAIADMRQAFPAWLQATHKGRSFDLARIESAADAYFDRLEEWHHKAGSLDDQIG